MEQRAGGQCAGSQPSSLIGSRTTSAAPLLRADLHLVARLDVDLLRRASSLCR
ncbi:hypothetical protein [Kitasatospora purpeofusca]|uniref:hypothetical protein n=1 Tax=Kitasatospora purpeofusca TaxID=67352 RepID=UPI003869F8C2|nr:hypothetical protein OIP63_33030 [Kitasatospora purpeofusca]